MKLALLDAMKEVRALREFRLNCLKLLMKEMSRLGNSKLRGELMTTGPEMLLIAGLKAFVPKETAEQINAVLREMLENGTLDGIGSLVADIAAIKRSQARIEFGLARIFAVLQSQGQLPTGSNEDRVPGDTGDGLIDIAPSEYRADGGPSGGSDASCLAHDGYSDDVPTDRPAGIAATG